MGKMSRDKGKRGEREVARLLRENGFEARRGQQFCGSSGDADVVGIEGVHIECKYVETLNIDDALQQSISDSREGEMPIVIHRKNFNAKKPTANRWKVTMLFDDYIKLIKEQDR